ncbi:MAG: HU family DNA-binding protein [Oscillospiraceae bacterium]|jgi:DNA-binding protein HU-beta|nr:HU family DNA-binding protein [Oscillospiraceae bacterium]
MNKTELSTAVAIKADLTRKQAETAVNAVVEIITENLVKGDKVQLVGFGTFEVRSRPARKARNPRTGEEISIAASNAPVFKAGKGLKDAVAK